MDQETSLREDIENAVAEVSEPAPVIQDTPDPAAPPAKEREQNGQFKAKEPVADPAATQIDTGVVSPAQDPAKEIIKPPEALSGAIKAKWHELPTDVQAEWAKREGDFHQMLTRHDGELRLGREMKDAVTPYMAQIQAEGGTPVGAVKDLLNTAYLLRTGSPQQKANLVSEIAKTYGVDLAQITAAPAGDVDPTIQALQDQIAELRTLSNPDTIRKQLQDQQEIDNINAEVKAFASDPANIHYEKVKGTMASLLGNGQVGSLKEAYESAIWSHPDIRSTLMQQQTQQPAKLDSDIASKKAAASSIHGSPGVTVPNSGAPERTLREEIAHNLRAATSS